MPDVHPNKLIEKRSSSKATATLKEEDKLHRLAFDNSAQPNIITLVSNGMIIMANSAASKLLGYSKKKLLTINRSAIFNIRENNFKKMLRQRTAEGNSVATVTVTKKSGKAITCKITSAVFKDEHGDEKAITTISDMSQGIRQQQEIDSKKEMTVATDIAIAKATQVKLDVRHKKKVIRDIALVKAKQKKTDIQNKKTVAGDIILAQIKSDARLAENNEWIKYIAKASYDVMWDWNIETGEIYVGDSIKEVFGYSLVNNTMHFKDFCQCLVQEEKEMVEKKIKDTLASSNKTWSDVFMFKHSNGTIASTTSRASVVRDESGKALHMIGAIQDISRLQEMEKKMEVQMQLQEQDSEKFMLAARLSFDVIWDWNIETNEVFLGDGFEELFGYAIKNNKANMITDWVDNLYPDDREGVVAELQACIRSAATHWEQAYRVSRADGSVAKVYIRASIMRHVDGKAYRMIGALQDLSRQKELEAKLEAEIELKEKEIAVATADAKEMTRSNIGKELHDNINQLLGASKLYMDMAKRGGDKTAMYLSRSSEYTLAAIDEIRKLTKGLTTDIIKTLGLCDAIENVAMDTMEVSEVKILCSTNSFIENSVNDKFKLNVFRIIQEQLNNILKHAHATKVSIKLMQNKKNIRLVIADNGTGFNADKNSKGIGISNITSRTASYHGTAAFESQPGKGCILTAVFPVTNQLLSKQGIAV
jgi:PAS domain S-box-containing protein